VSPRSPIIAVAAGYPPLGRFIALSLRVAGYDPHLLADGEQALEYLLSQPVDAAVLDGVLGKVDGFTICQRMRAVSATPIVLLLMRDEAHQQIRSRQVGASAVLLIPFGADNLLACVKTLLSQERTSRGEPA
jgi:DNA-binding response OmpR family regulator